MIRVERCEFFGDREVALEGTHPSSTEPEFWQTLYAG